MPNQHLLFKIVRRMFSRTVFWQWEKIFLNPPRKNWQRKGAYVAHGISVIKTCKNCLPDGMSRTAHQMACLANNFYSMWSSGRGWQRIGTSSSMSLFLFQVHQLSWKQDAQPITPIHWWRITLIHQGKGDVQQNDCYNEATMKLQ